jgi:hypothetical protein
MIRTLREDALHRGVHVVRTLQRAAHRDAPLLGALGDHAVVLDVELIGVADVVGSLDDPVRGGKTRHRVAAADQDLLEDVVLAVEKTFLRQRLLHGQHGFERFVLDPHGRHGRLGAFGVLVSQEENRLLGVADLFGHQERLIIADQRDHVLARDVLVIGDHHAVPVEGGVEFDSLDSSAWDGGADGATVEHSGNAQVIDIESIAGYLAGALEFGNTLSDGSGFRRITIVLGPADCADSAHPG